MSDVARVKLDPNMNLVDVATRAGEGGITKRWYADGFLYVEGVTQEQLDAAAATATPNVPKPPEESGDRIAVALVKLLAGKGIITKKELVDILSEEELKARNA